MIENGISVIGENGISVMIENGISVIGWMTRGFRLLIVDNESAAE